MGRFSCCRQLAGEVFAGFPVPAFRNTPPGVPAQRAENSNTTRCGAEMADKMPVFGDYSREIGEIAGNIDNLVL